MDAVKAWGEVDENPREGSWGVGGDTAAATSDTHGDVVEKKDTYSWERHIEPNYIILCTIV